MSFGGFTHVGFPLPMSVSPPTLYPSSLRLPLSPLSPSPVTTFPSSSCSPFMNKVRESPCGLCCPVFVCRSVCTATPPAAAWPRLRHCSLGDPWLVPPKSSSCCHKTRPSPGMGTSWRWVQTPPPTHTHIHRHSLLLPGGFALFSPEPRVAGWDQGDHRL